MQGGLGSALAPSFGQPPGGLGMPQQAGPTPPMATPSPYGSDPRLPQARPPQERQRHPGYPNSAAPAPSPVDPNNAAVQAAAEAAAKEAARAEAAKQQEARAQSDTFRSPVSNMPGGDLNLAPEGDYGGPGSYGSSFDDPYEDTGFTPFSERVDPYTGRPEREDEDEDEQSSTVPALQESASVGQTTTETDTGGGDPNPGPGTPLPTPPAPQPELAARLDEEKYPALTYADLDLPPLTRGALAHSDEEAGGRHQHQVVVMEGEPDYVESPIRSALDRGGAFGRDWGRDPVVDSYLEGTASHRGFGSLTGGDADTKVRRTGERVGKWLGAGLGFAGYPGGLIPSALAGLVGYKVGGKVGGLFDRDVGLGTRWSNPGRHGRARDPETGKLLDYTVDENGMYHYDDASLNVVQGAPAIEAPITAVSAGEAGRRRLADIDATERAAVQQQLRDEEEAARESMSSRSSMGRVGFGGIGGIFGNASALGGSSGYGGANIGYGTGGAINPNR